jgi:hypothetical protein
VHNAHNLLPQRAELALETPDCHSSVFIRSPKNTRGLPPAPLSFAASRLRVSPKTRTSTADN